MGDADKNKRKKNYYADVSQKKFRDQTVLQPGLKGYLVTCNFREVECVRESYNLLNEYIDRLNVLSSQADQSQEDNAVDDLEAELRKEVQELRNSPKRLKQADTKCKNIIFIQSTDPTDPVQVVNAIFEDIEATKKQKARYALRLIPVSATCKATCESVEKCVEDMLNSRSDLPDEEVNYKIECKVRNNNDLSRMALIDEAAKLLKVKRPKWRVNFKDADVTLNIDVIIRTCCVSFFRNFNHYCKYNLVEFGTKVTKKPDDVEADLLVKALAVDESKAESEITNVVTA
jgi:tRNA acetyltransferase TAN1